MRCTMAVCVVATLGVVWNLCRGANLIPMGDLECDTGGPRPPEFWHRAGGDYLSAFPDWQRTEDTPASGRWAVTTTTGREFIACGDGSAGQIRASVMLRAEKAGTTVRVRLSWWNRLNRTDVIEEVAAGADCARFEIATEARQGGPMELAVRNGKPGVRIWADDFRIEGPPPPDQLVERQRIGEQDKLVPVPVVRPKPFDLSNVQPFTGEAADTAGRVAITVNVPENCVQVPTVSGGVPFPRGRLFRRERVRVLDADAREVPAQVEVLSRWHLDRSIMMLLITVPRPAASRTLTLEFGPEVRRTAVSSPVDAQAAVHASRLIDEASGSGPTIQGGDGTEYVGRVVERRVEQSGPLAATVAVYGEHVAADGRRCGRWVARCTSWRGSVKVGVEYCWINDERTPVIPVRAAWFDWRAGAPPEPGRTLTQVALDRDFYSSDARVVGRPDARSSKGGRSDGLVDGRLAVRDFWQNHPCAVENTKDGYRLWVWPESVRGVLIPQGFARQWEFLWDRESRLSRPFRTDRLAILHADPEWMCDSGVFEFLMEPDPRTFPIFERRVGSAATLGRFAHAQKESRNLFGVFNYGDAPGDGGWSNLESIAAHELFLHWVRTGSREHFDVARLAAEHYRDVDIHHGAGFCHTHCNNHVHSGEGWSHSWIQGVRDLYFLLGDFRALAVLQEVGERVLTKEPGWTTGRDWTRPIDNVVDMYGAIGDPRYLACARSHIAELGRRQLPENAVCGAERNSWYEDRYSAGCAFTWYGCQAMAKLHQQTGDKEVLDILRREIDLSLNVQRKSERSFAILPGTQIGEDWQATDLGGLALGRGSTLFPPLGYLAHETGDRGYLDLGMKIFAHYMLNLRGGSDASATSYATVFLHYAKEAGLGPKEEAAAFQRAKDFTYERWPQGVKNGGFEEPAFAHWQVKRVPGQDFYYDNLVKVGYYQDDKVSHSGRRSLRLHSDNRSRVISVSGRFALRPKWRWRASVWVKADETMNPRVGLSLREYDTDRGAGVALRPRGEPAAGWQEYAGEFTTIARTVATWGLVNRRGTGDAWFDDVSIEDLGAAHWLLTNNGGGRDWRKPAYPGLNLDTGGTYLPDKKMSTDLQDEGQPVPFTEGCLTEGVSKYNHLQKPLGS